MEYYLQILLGLVVLIGVVVPMSTDMKAIKIKNIIMIKTIIELL